MPRVYFDTNVYDHIEKGYVASADVDALRLALSRGDLIAHLSIVDVEEFLGQWKTNRTAAIRKLQIAHDIVGFDEILKQPRDLLEDGVRAYAEGNAAPSPIMPLDQQKVIEASLLRIVGGDTRLDPVVSDSLEKMRLMNDRFLRNMTDSRTEVLAEWEEIVAKAGHNVTFEEYWAAGATGFAEDLVPADYVAACCVRGFNRLLDVRAMRLCVGALMSLIFSQIVGDGTRSRQPKLGDAYDLWHAVQASVADVFVTYDKRFAGLLRRVPIDGFNVFSTIPELLQSIRSTQP
jgi:hypothetical protein